MRDDFPILQRKINGYPLVYLDNAATTQKPASVINAMNDYYANSNANVHRAVHTLAGEATEGYESCRTSLKQRFNCDKAITGTFSSFARDFNDLEISDIWLTLFSIDNGSCIN